MAQSVQATNINIRKTGTAVRTDSFLKSVKKDRWLYILMLPGVLYYIIFKYMPMFGLVIAFQDYQSFLGFINSPWVGFRHFAHFFSDPAFFMLFKNTLVLGLCNLIFFFPIPIIVALLLNEIRSMYFKRTVQTFIYIPHFLSWIIIASITQIFFSVDDGIINNLLTQIGLEKINILMSEGAFLPTIIGQVIWKESGWGTIIFLAALAGVNPELYTAAEVDGAGRWRKLWNITLPSIRSTIVVLLIIRTGTFLDTGFEQLLLMINASNRNVGEVFDTYIYSMGIVQGQFSYTTAAGLFKSALSLILILVCNKISKKFGEEGII